MQRNNQAIKNRICRSGYKFPLLLLTGVLLLSGSMVRSQNPGTGSDTLRLKLYLDCRDCNLDYFRRNLTYLDFVRDPKVSDLHLLVTEQSTASDGRSYGFNFIGSGAYSDLNYKLNTVSPQSDTDIQTWERLLKTTQMGLMPFLSRTSEFPDLNIDYQKDTAKFQSISGSSDLWNFWVFRLDIGTDLEMEERQNELSVFSSFGIDRITEMHKYRFDIFYSGEKETFLDNNETIESIREEIDSDIELVFSLGPRWSVGAFSELRSSTYQNTELSYRLGPALEYNIFPWDQSDRRVFTFGYHIQGHWFNYLEPTIYELTSELRASESLRLALLLRQPWGEVEMEIAGSHYFHDISRYSLLMESDISLNITKGLAIYAELNAGIVHDQLYLPAGEITREELLLKLRQLESTYELSIEFGLRFTFGSIYNNIVNQRL